MQMYTEKSKKLVRELKTSKWLPPFNNGLINEISAEITELHGKVVESLASQNDSLAVLQAGCIERNKRGVLAYLNYRAAKLESLRVENGPTIPPHYSHQLCSDEADYFRKYSALLQEYSQKVCEFVDITTDLVPPKDLFIEVRVKEDIGDIVLPVTGQVTFKKNTVQLVRREEVAALVRQGALKQTK
jgi:GINS complex subunit 1